MGILGRLMREARDLRRTALRVPTYQLLVGRARLLYYVKLRRRLRLLDSKDAFETTVSHNLQSLKDQSFRTPETLLGPLKAIELMDEHSKVLIIGPRNEYDLMAAVGYGFGRKNVRGLDLISYSPQIDLGDMHAAPYPDSSFDAVVIGWTLSYSRQPAAFAKEMLRIVRDGGLIAIGVEYTEMTPDELEQVAGYRMQEAEYVPERINSVPQILSLFQGHVRYVYFQHDAPAKMTHTPERMIERASKVATIFSVDKSGTASASAQASARGALGGKPDRHAALDGAR